LVLLRFAALSIALVSLASCDPVSWTLAGVAIDVGLHGYELAGRVTSGLSQGIEIQCRALIAKEAALEATGQGATVAAAERWSGAAAFCDPANPPPADPIAGAFWLGTVIAKLE
jgi:hypothetical protein